MKDHKQYNLPTPPSQPNEDFVSLPNIIRTDKDLNLKNKFIVGNEEIVNKLGQKFKRTLFSTLLSGSVYSAATSDFLIGITNLSYAPSIGLPHPNLAGEGKTYIIKDEAGGAATTTITIRSVGERTIDGASSDTITTNYGVKSYYSDGANWFTNPSNTSSSGGSSGSAVTLVPRPNFPCASDELSTVQLNSETVLNLGQLVVPLSVTVNKISVEATTVTVPGTIDLTIYSEDGQTQKFSITSDTISSAGISTTAVSAVALTPAVYYVAANSNNTTDVTIRSWSLGASGAFSGSTTSEPVLTGTTSLTALTVTATQLTSDSSNTDATSYTTSSVSPGTNKLLILAVYSRKTTDSTSPTVTGNGLSWVEIGNQTDTGNSLRMIFFRAMGTPTAGAITIDYGAKTQELQGWSLTEFDNVDTSGTSGSGAVIQFVGNRDEVANTGLTVTLAAFQAAGNATFGAVRAGNTIAPGSGFTELTEQTASDIPFFESEWKNSADTSVDWTWSSSGSFAIGAAIEIKAQVSVPSTLTPGSIISAADKTAVIRLDN